MVNASLMLLKDSTVGWIEKLRLCVRRHEELGNGGKRIKHLEPLVNQILILTTTLAWEAKLRVRMTLMVMAESPFLWHWAILLVWNCCSVFPFPSFSLSPVLAPEGQFRDRPSLLMQFLTTASSCSTGRSCEKNIFLLFSLSFSPPCFPYRENKVHYASCK